VFEKLKRWIISKTTIIFIHCVCVEEVTCSYVSVSICLCKLLCLSVEATSYFPLHLSIVSFSDISVFRGEINTVQWNDS
jgi:hypothetical protein